MPDRLPLLALLLALAACAPAPPEPSATRLLLPPGPGPHPAAVVLSGCDGVHDNALFWAEEMVREGRAALVLDSHGPRGLAEGPRWRLVCAALALRGPERARDVAQALEALARDPRIDAGDVVLLGASHGGWAAMELVAAQGDDPEPARVSALVLLYPYCGVLNGAEPEGWRGAPPTLMVLGGRDRIVRTSACLDRAARLGAVAPVEVLLWPEADHAFDQEDKAPTSSLPFDPALREQTRAAVAAWLAGLGAP